MDEKSLQAKEEIGKAGFKALEALEASVNWPEVTHGAEPGGYTPNGMGGTLVYAAWQGRTGSVIPDHLKLSFNSNHYLLAGAEGPLAEEFLRQGDQVITDLVLIAASSGGIVQVSAEDENGNFSEATPFVVTRESLSTRGLALLEVLEELHGGPATLVTYNSDDRWTNRWH